MRRFLRLTPAIFALVLGLPLTAGAQVVEVEPNNTLPQADAAPHFTGDVVISAGISPVADTDIFRLNLAADSVLRIESFDFSGTDCVAGASTVRLFSFAGAPMYADTGSGILGCAALVVALEAGTYYVSVEETGNDASIPGYKLQIKVQVSLGAEIEPNGTRPEATAIVGSDVYVLGSRPAVTDSDYYAVTVPAGASIRAEVIEGDSVLACDANEIDSELVLWDASGSFRTSGDDLGRGLCSRIDGTGAAPASPGAGSLPAGTYFLELRHPPDPTGNTIFNYRLVVRVVSPDLIFEDDFEAGGMAQVVINEFNANIAGSCDLIELRVISSGGMNGYSLRERDTSPIVSFTGLTVATNDLIVVHLDTADPACNPGSSPNETLGPAQSRSVFYAANYDTAYDWYSTDTGLTATDNVLTLYDNAGRIMDAVLTADDPAGMAALGSENQAATVAAAGQWQRVGGGVPPGGFVDDDFCAHAVLDLNDTGTTAAGPSIQRTTNVDSNDKDGWTTGAGGAPTWGQLNVGQTP